LDARGCGVSGGIDAILEIGLQTSIPNGAVSNSSLKLSNSIELCYPAHFTSGGSRQK
jgi:hypothetical protein